MCYKELELNRLSPELNQEFEHRDKGVYYVQNLLSR